MENTIPTPDETDIAVRVFVGEVEAYANRAGAPPFLFGGRMCDDLELVIAELFDAHPYTQALVSAGRQGWK